MGGRADLAALLERIDGRGYKAYKAVEGRWDFGAFTLSVDHVQGDPYASPTRVSVTRPPHEARLPPSTLTSAPRRAGTAAYLARHAARSAEALSRDRGTGHSGRLRVADPGPWVLPQTAVRIDADGGLEARFTMGLPARGRRVAGGPASEMMLDDVAELVTGSFVGDAHAAADLEQAAEVNEDAEALRAALREEGLVAFVADGSVLPRRSGVDDRPLVGERVRVFESPPALRVELEAPNAGRITGLGVRAGVTLIVGGGFHGKSTLLRALETGVYNHAPGDGRERVVTLPDAVKVRAEDGRAVAGVDISAFIGDLPTGDDTRRFGTVNASGSTSQAAALVEALESGASVLLIDEDTAATNFMLRDRRMQALVAREAEPITPLLDRVRELYDEMGVSAVLVVGGSGDYLDVADTVIQMEAFQPRDVTERAAEVAESLPTGRVPERARPFAPPAPRVPDPASLDPSRGRRRVDVRARGRVRIEFGESAIDLSAVEQLVTSHQTRALAGALALAYERYVDGRRSVGEILDAVLAAVTDEGLDVLSPWPVGDLMVFRRHELAAALNRLRSLEIA